MFANWMKLAMATSMLAMESQQVIAMRLMKMSLGGKASSNEANLMFSEKAQALGETAMSLATGGSAHSIVNNYRGKVRANRRRLSKG
jgi:hypothetical protein